MRIEILLPDATESLNVEDSDQRSLAEVLRAKNLPLNTRCGQRDMCAGCLIDLMSGELEHIVTGAVSSRPESDLRGCRYRPLTDVLIRVPERSRLSYAPQVLDSYRINIPYARAPLVDHGLGVAVDVGTTTVALLVWDLLSGDLIGRASGFNKQMHFGDDVLTRINLCSTDSGAVGRLQQCIVQETIAPLLCEALGGRPIEEVTAFAIAGNTTMLHLLAGEDPSPMGVAPFTPRFTETRVLSAQAIGLQLRDAKVYLLPSIAAYVGADLTGGLFASGLLYEDGPAMLVDIGTNGEILLRSAGRTYGCATAAGPAFEGSGLTCGIRAGEGAISHLRIGEDSKFIVERIGSGKPTGICGSAYIDFLAEGTQSGFLSPAGRFARFDGPLTQQAGGLATLIAYGQGKRPIVITEGDVAKLLQAKAAIAAGITTLLKRCSLAPNEIKTLYLAGGFGMHLRLDSAIRCGLLPGFQPQQVQLVGNTALGGAAVALLDSNTLPELSRARQEVEIVELNLEPGFEDCYLDHLGLNPDD